MLAGDAVAKAETRGQREHGSVEAVPDNHFATTPGAGGEVGNEGLGGILLECGEGVEARGVEDVGGEVAPKRPPKRAMVLYNPSSVMLRFLS